VNDAATEPGQRSNAKRNAAVAIAALVVVALLWGRRRSTSKKAVPLGAGLA